MTTQVIMILNEEETDSRVYAQASGETTSINIFAKTLEEAKGMLQEGEELAKKAQAESAGIEEETDRKITHTYCAPMSAEEAQEAIERYTQDKEGGQFARRIEKAYNFARKHDNTGFFSLWQGRFFGLMAWATDPYEAIIKSYTLGFYKGFNKAKKEAKEAKKGQ